MTAQDFRNLFSHQQAANELYIKMLFPNDSKFSPYAYRMIWHIHIAQNVWSCRILKKEFKWNFEQEFDLHTLRMVIRENEEMLNQILDTMDLNAAIEYKNIKGESYQSLLSDILLHVSHHYSYHRGQIARCIREADVAPPPTDLILWRRQKIN